LRGWALAVALAAGASACAPSASATTVPGCHSAWPVVAHRAGGGLVKLPRGARRPIACATETGYATSESSLAVTKNGVLVYSPAESEHSMARSLDGGASWSLTYPAVEQPTSIRQTAAPYVIADRRSGRVCWAPA